MLGHRRRRWPSITSTLDKSLEFAGKLADGIARVIIPFFDGDIVTGFSHSADVVNDPQCIYKKNNVFQS